MITGIYKITSPTNKIYIGQSINIQKRKTDYSGLHCYRQNKIYNSLKKYGWDQHKFEIIHELPNDVSQDILDNYEILYWEQYKNLGFNMLNIKNPGKYGRIAEETKIKIKNSLLNHLVSQDTKDKISIKIKEHYKNGTYHNSNRSHLGNRGVIKGKKFPKNNRPTKEYLQSLLLDNKNLIEISKLYNVSSATIKNWINDYNLSYKSQTNRDRAISVNLIDLDNNIINTFNSYKEVSIYFDKDKSTISEWIKKDKIINNKYKLNNIKYS